MGIPLSPPPSQDPPKGDEANAVVTGIVNAGNSSLRFTASGWFNVSVWGGPFVATPALKRSFDGGVTWIPCFNADGSEVSVDAPASFVWFEPEQGVSYILDATGAYTSGTFNYRFSTTGRRAQSQGF